MILKYFFHSLNYGIHWQSLLLVFAPFLKVFFSKLDSMPEHIILEEALLMSNIVLWLSLSFDSLLRFHYSQHSIALFCCLHTLSGWIHTSMEDYPQVSFSVVARTFLPQSMFITMIRFSYMHYRTFVDIKKHPPVHRPMYIVHQILTVLICCWILQIEAKHKTNNSAWNMQYLSTNFYSSF